MNAVILGGVNVYIQAQEMPYACSRVGFSFHQMFRQTVFCKNAAKLLNKEDGGVFLEKMMFHVL